MASASSFTVLCGTRAVDLDAGRILVHQRERRVAVGLELGEALPVHHRDLDRDDAERVAVGGRGGDRRMADDARAAGAVDDVEGLLQLLLQHRRDDARGRVGAAAGAPGADDGDGAVRPGLGARRSQPSVATALAAPPPIKRSRRVYLPIVRFLPEEELPQA